MFERFTEDARRVLFFARFKTTERYGDSITPEDVLGGIVWAVPHVVVRFESQPTEALTPTETAEDFMSRLAHDKNLQTYTSREIRFSATTKVALQRAAEEADELRHTAIRPEHLLLALLRDENSQASRTLNEAGVTLREVRHVMAEEPGVQS
jgi:ATP-dependent Clp protease ATP-binding subunit ClpC